MGFLHESEPLTWEQSLASLRFVRDHGIEQFLAVLERCRGCDGDPFKWGDEVEHQVFRLVGSRGDADRSAKLSLRSPDILAQLQRAETARRGAGEDGCTWVPEYGRWMLESTPGEPYLGLEGILGVERQLCLRRELLAAALQPGEVAPTVTAFPLMGVADCTEPQLQPCGPVMKSLFLADGVIFPHPRFPTLARHIRERRGGKVEIRRPLMPDARTRDAKYASPDFVPQTVHEADLMSHVYADAMAFGMGSSCLQVTLQAPNITQSRRLYDQLAPLTPLLLALTAATPFLRGWICDDDVRWSQIAQSVDDRTPAERGLTSAGSSEADARLAGSGTRSFRKSRYDGIDCYIGEGKETASFNDLPMSFSQRHLARLVDAGVDENLAQHVAHLFARDPLVLFGDRIELDDHKDIDHWENLQSTNWQSLRWKPPPPHKGELDGASEDHIGWRVEFRSMELQMTDFENAAFIAFVVLVSRALMELKVDLRIPISALDENMLTARGRDACTEGRFWFRVDVEGAAEGTKPALARMTIEEILRGSAAFVGLIPLCRRYLAAADCGPAARCLYERYLEFIAQRAEGRLLTTAGWMRRFVLSHPSYERDSRVPAAAAHDLLVAASEIGLGLRPCPELLGGFCGPAAPERIAAPCARHDASAPCDCKLAWAQAQAGPDACTVPGLEVCSFVGAA